MSLLAWHFSRLNHCLSHGDGRKIVAGETLSVSPPIELFGNGLHASEDIMEALANAPGLYIWRVELSGEMVSDYGQVAAEHRKALWGFDATDVLQYFARLCALDVIHLWDAPAVVREYLETGREELRSAAEAAEAATRSAPGSAGKARLARAAAESAWSAWLAEAAVWAVAAGKSVFNAEDVIREKQRVRLEKMIEAARINC